MAQQLLLFQLMIFSSWAAATIAFSSQPLQTCPQNCGNVTIPFPFGTSEGCYMDTEYSITCNTSYNPPKPFLVDGQHEVLSIPLDGEILIEGRRSYASYCPNSTGSDLSKIHVSLNGSPFRFSNRNRFTAMGCNTMATISELEVLGFASGCLSFCTYQTVVDNGSCDGKGCCQNKIPKGLQGFNVSLSSALTFNGTWETSTCSFAFLVAEDSFSFQALDLSETSLNMKNIPVAVDWAIGNSTCEAAVGGPICGPNSNCSNSSNNVTGYRCYCNKGFEGNPYLSIGCQDINECKEGYNNSCAAEARCFNTYGSYECKCPDHHHGDGREDGQGCMHNTGAIPLVAIVAGTGLGIIFLFVCMFLLYWAIKRRKLIKLREKFFENNGGLLLRQHIATRKDVEDIAKIFTLDDIKKATNNFDERRILGQGGNGTVYKGILSNKAVAIKKSKIVDQSQIIQFINEVDILSQINHRNVVKLLGCCLETEVPLLVYEFISSGTLYEHIHEENHASYISWEDRLRVAAETAGALAYLHSSHSIPVLHRDVKSTNILLDDKYIAKVSDFGASRLAPMDRIQMTTLVQGTFGYLDPESFLTGQLTDKSDVYSFGVVLAELLTGEKPLSSARAEEHTSLAMYFISSMENNNLFQIIDDQVIEEGIKEQLLGVANLVMKCLKVKGEKRPTMKEVAAELDALRMSNDYSWKQQNHMESDYQLAEPLIIYVGESSGQESVESNLLVPLHIAR
ncbi:hypothetical protein NE237_022814 [Protea cynaroides]|uniref:Uncharacterized protein n=1 Tax=Protea cynaroides TaxID=273540 RepID=A0A9Q0HDW6_9MAGN|nr:hypothetical protein NE237_022814 [Protea cynaroides]